MKIVIDTDRRVLTRETDGHTEAELPLFGPDAFDILSREWVRIGWARHYYYGFSWMGRPILQLPQDMVRLQEVLHVVQPDVIVETGVFEGGSLVFHASLCRVLGKGRVIGIDIEITDDTRYAVAHHPLGDLIRVIEGDSTSPAVVDTVRGLIQPGETVLVILDSNHTAAHVRKELEAYAPLVTLGSCIVVTDGVMRDLSDVPGGSPEWVEDNPCTAAREFLAVHPEFESRNPSYGPRPQAVNHSSTYWPDGWLWRVSV